MYDGTQINSEEISPEFAKTKPKWPLVALMVLLIMSVVGGVWYYAEGRKAKPENEKTALSGQGTESDKPVVSVEKSTGTIADDDTPATNNNSTLGASLKTYEGQGFSFQYPENWTAVSAENKANSAIKAQVTITANTGAIFNLYNPAREVGYEAWDSGSNKEIKAASGLAFSRTFAQPKASTSGIDPLYLAAYSDNDFSKTIELSGTAKGLTQTTVDQLDALASTIKFDSIVAKIDSTAGWKNYSSSTYNFSFKYPSSWKVDTSEKTDPSLWDINDKLRVTTRSSECYSGDSNPNCKSFEVYVYKNGTMEKNNAYYIEGKKSGDGQIAGKNWTKIVVSKNESVRWFYDYVVYYTVIGDNTYMLDYISDNSGTIDKVVSSFQFTK
ncbi:MAG: hypothetical protein WCT32_02240 [Patescibacteria group bacterium]|jgi:hypothetical protein